MNLSEEELTAIDPGYIVIDEFHRCGASKWGQGYEYCRRYIQEHGDINTGSVSFTYDDF